MVRNLMMIVGLTLAVAAFGCDSDSSNAAGSGGSGGSGGGGGEGGAAGEGGAGGAPGGGIAPACDNPDDIAAGDPDVTACATAAAISNPEYCDPDSSGLATCLAGDNTQSAECLDCWADLSCCTLGECSVLVGGPCAGAPEPGDPCDLCVQEKCQPAFGACGA